MLKINQYFDGKVASIALNTATLPATVGVMDIGDYQFDTSQHEVMTIISGQLSVKLPGSNEYQDFSTGDQFEVAANQAFSLKVPIQTAYFCTYRD
ncbi:MAG: pyrimidine/purine nucleoside phosphorylase [Acidiferrobacterales bacterium]|nr:pyrimidine/purine nucleoside phosphorylase [Acidiferrobacterales bacterium]